MRRLILLRHGKAEAHARTGEDIDRPLAERGVADARLVGQALAQAGYAPDAARISAARRAIQTWQAVSQVFPTAEAEFLKSLYNAEPEMLLAEAEAADGETVMVVAHNPGMHQLLLQLARRSNQLDQVARGFSTATAAVFERDGAGAYRLLQMFYPEDLAGDPR